MVKRKINIGRNTINSRKKRLVLRHENEKKSESRLRSNVNSKLSQQKKRVFC